MTSLFDALLLGAPLIIAAFLLGCLVAEIMQRRRRHLASASPLARADGQDDPGSK